MLAPRNTTPRRNLVDYARGGTGIGDASAGLDVKDWTATYDTPDVIVEASGVSPTVVLSVPSVRQLSLAFDQNMRAYVAYQLADGTSHFYYYNTLLSAFDTLDLPAGSHNPRCAMDDIRKNQSSASDVILAYTRGDTLYFRAQRDRFATEYTLTAGLAGRFLVDCGMNVTNRFQFVLGI